MQFQLNTYAIDHIRHLLNLVDIPDSQKKLIEEQVTNATEEELQNLTNKLQVIREWEILEELDDEFSEVQENFAEWIEKMKKGLVDTKTAEQIEEETLRIEQILKRIQEHKQQQ